MGFESLCQVCRSIFTRFLGVEVQYKFNTLIDVVIPSLKRVYHSHYQTPMPRVMREQPKVGLEAVCHTLTSVNHKAQGKEPLMLQDLKLIIDGMPELLK